MSEKTTSLPDGWGEQSPEWHLDRFVEFTKYKMEIGEPSPHLAIVGHMCKDSSLEDKLWLLGCYAATYCLPTAQVLWNLKRPEKIRANPVAFEQWLTENWRGIVTRTERRCVRTPKKMAQCLLSYTQWMEREFPRLQRRATRGLEPNRFYDIVWESVNTIKFFGRYINIRLVEGLRRYCGIPASLYDIRSIGGWSPKKALAYFYPQHAEKLLIDNQEGNWLTNKLAYRLLRTVRKQLPKVDCYILAAMLCEYKGAFEKRHQFVGWTISQEPDLYRKVKAYWGRDLKDKLFWGARADLFPHVALEEFNDWKGMRWPLARCLRDFGYVWSDLYFDYSKTLAADRFADPVRRK